MQTQSPRPYTGPALPLELGHIVRGRYRIESRIGAGASSHIYAARDLENGRRWAIKCVRQSGLFAAQRPGWCSPEGQILTQLSHPNVVSLQACEVDEAGRSFLVLEHLDGEDLQSFLDRKIRLPVDQALDITRQVASALTSAHCLEIVHRDIKPSNLFLCPPERKNRTGEKGSASFLVKVLDFGIAKNHGVASIHETVPGTLLGTPQYMPPELTRGGAGPADPRSDQWSLAVVLYRMLAGCLPFHDADCTRLFLKIRNEHPVALRVHVPGLPEWIGSAVERALSKRPEERFPTVQDFIRALYGIRQLPPGTGASSMQSETTNQGRTGAPRDLPPVRQERITPLAMLGCLVLLIGAAMGSAATRPMLRTVQEALTRPSHGVPASCAPAQPAQRMLPRPVVTQLNPAETQRRLPLAWQRPAQRFPPLRLAGELPSS